MKAWVSQEQIAFVCISTVESHADTVEYVGEDTLRISHWSYIDQYETSYEDVNGKAILTSSICCPFYIATDLGR